MRLKLNPWPVITRVVGWSIARFYLHDSRLSYLVRTRYPTFMSLFSDVVNQAAYLLHSDRIYAPSAVVTVELTNACNLRCEMCPITSRMQRKKAFFPLAVYRELLDANPEIRRIILADWGEPLLHPDLFEFVREAASRGIQTMVTSNGVLLDERRAQGLLDAGLHILRVSLDGTGEVYRSLRHTDYGHVRSAVESFLNRRNAGNYSTSVEISCVVTPQNADQVAAVREEWGSKVDFVNFQGQILYGGSNKRTRPCRELYRSLIILAGGEVVPCCVDYDGVLAIGNVHQERRLMALANSDALREMRRDHWSGRMPNFCRECVEYDSRLAPKRF